MADAAAVQAMEALQSCRCCLRRPPDKGLKTLYENVGKTENYWDMLKECFNIHLNVGNDECGICEVCVARLRDATEFKMQVQQSQVELKALLEKALQEKDKKPSLIKVELVEEDPNVEEVMIQDDGPVKSEMGDGDIVSSLLSSGESSDAESVTSEFEHNNSPFNCQKRLKTLALQANLAKHMERLKTIALKTNLAKHMALHPKGNVATKTKALSTGDSSDAESVMSESEDNNSPMKSRECLATFNLGDSHTKHMDMHAIGSVATETETLLCGESSDAESAISGCEDNNSPFKCQECQKTFDLEGSLTKHMTLHAKGSVATETKTLSSGDSSDAESVILESEDNNSPIKSRECQATFDFGDSLTKDMDMHAIGTVATETETLRCGEPSDAEFVISECEVNNSPFKCQECQKTFDLEGSLTKHMDMHAIGSVATETESLRCGEPSDAEFVISECEENNSPFKCQECQKTFDLEGSLTKHMDMHAIGSVATVTQSLRCGEPSDAESVISECEDNNSPFKCQVCQKTFDLEGSLTKHMTLHAKGSVATETKTLSSGDSSDAESVILESEDNNSPIKSRECQATFDLGDSLTKHMDMHAIGTVATETETLRCGEPSDAESVISECEDNNTPFKCQECQKTFDLEDSLTKHMDVHARGSVVNETKTLSSGDSSDAESFISESGDNNSPFKCQECQKTFDLEDSLTKHMAVHTIGSVATVTETLLSAESPDAESVISESEDNIYNSPKGSSTTDMKTHMCDVCCEIFELYADLTKHMETHNDLRRGLCKNTSHMRIHTRVKLYSCEVCDKKFGHNHHMKRHMQSHKGDIFCCQVCPKKFAEQSQLKEHELAHTEIRTASCENSCNICCERFEQKNDLTNHMEIHNQLVTEGGLRENISPTKESSVEEKRFSCEVCNRKFRHNHHLEQHTTSHQKGRRQISPKKFLKQSDLKEHVLDNKLKKPYVCEYKCHFCSQSFKLKTDLTKHMEIHYEKEDFRCGLCKKVLANKNSLKVHMSTHTGEKPYSCQVCSMQFGQKHHLKRHHMNAHKEEYSITSQIRPKKLTEQTELRKHEPVDAGRKTYNCETCKKRFSSNIHLQIHILGHKKEEAHTCQIRKGKFKNKSLLDTHVKSCIDKSHTCEICEAIFKRKSGLMTHLNTHIKKRQSFTCDVCKKQFPQKYRLARHMRVHVREKWITCKVCKEQFADRSSLHSHQRIHAEMKLFQCDVCKMQFQRKPSLRTHKLIRHTGENRNSCDVCGKQFKDIKSLNIHMRNHTSPKPYSCKICKKLFSTKGGLQTHMKFHIRDRPYVCNLCQKSFIFPSELVVHTRIHTGEKAFACDICGKAFLSQGRLNRHLGSHCTTD